MYVHFVKRLIDFIIVFCTLMIIWPILLLISIWLYFANKGAGVFLLRNVRERAVRFSKSSNLKQ